MKFYVHRINYNEGDELKTHVWSLCSRSSQSQLNHRPSVVTNFAISKMDPKLCRVAISTISSTDYETRPNAASGDQLVLVTLTNSPTMFNSAQFPWKQKIVHLSALESILSYRPPVLIPPREWLHYLTKRADMRNNLQCLATSRSRPVM